MGYLNLGLFSLIVGLLGVFYRNILKEDNMVLAPLYRLFEKMVEKGGFIKWVAYPLGYCIYCSTTWVAIFGYLIVYRKVSIEIFVPIAVSHIIVDMYCKYVLGDILKKRYELAKTLVKKPQRLEVGGKGHDETASEVKMDIQKAHKEMLDKIEELGVKESHERRKKAREVQLEKSMAKLRKANAELAKITKDHEKVVEEPKQKEGLYLTFIKKLIADKTLKYGKCPPLLAEDLLEFAESEDHIEYMKGVKG